jgi:hypothetical protein
MTQQENSLLILFISKEFHLNKRRFNLELDTKMPRSLIDNIEILGGTIDSELKEDKEKLKQKDRSDRRALISQEEIVVQILL